MRTFPLKLSLILSSATKLLSPSTFSSFIFPLLLLYANSARMNHTVLREDKMESLESEGQNYAIFFNLIPSLAFLIQCGASFFATTYYYSKISIGR